ncbi:MAG: hypothetical protein NTZ49_00365 [Candidatus Parcubacteria bacterium]|nr:hypothetical protein [Candidatus Parcubacteria bacterium]
MNGLARRQEYLAKVQSGLPQIPCWPADLMGYGLALSCLPTPEVMASQIRRYRDAYSAEHLPFSYMCYFEPAGGKKRTLKFVLNTDNRRSDRPVLTCLNDDDAIRIALGNLKANHAMSPIRWEIYKDRNLQELVDMGRFDQFDLLGPVDGEKLNWLQLHGIEPKGNWDFDHMVYPMTCRNCGHPVGVNGQVMNIDVAICENCGNRPFLTHSLDEFVSELLEQSGELNGRWLSSRQLHVLSWISSSGANFSQVRLSGEKDVPTAELKVVKLFDAFGVEMLKSLPAEEREQCSQMLSRAKSNMLGSGSKSPALVMAERSYFASLVEHFHERLKNC